jgi:NAD(P)-dependent dehydrogenase (short-subunit alcohol dehydrogenase family)
MKKKVVKFVQLLLFGSAKLKSPLFLSRVGASRAPMPPFPIGATVSYGRVCRGLLMRTPVQRFGHLDELAGATVFPASDGARFVTGRVLVVDGGILAIGVDQ